VVPGGVVARVTVEDCLDKVGNRFALVINVQVEGHLDLKGNETTEHAMRTMEEGTNEITTALNDWIRDIREYNEYRGAPIPAFIGGFFPKFPSKLDFYEGKIQELDVDNMNPDKTEPGQKKGT
jgi:DNA-directed RNA polymerase subunit K/omega